MVPLAYLQPSERAFFLHFLLICTAQGEGVKMKLWLGQQQWSLE